MQPEWCRSHHQQDEVTAVAILFQAVSAQQRHIGILHRDGGELRVLDLQGHHELRNDRPQGPFLWVRPELKDSVLRSVAGLCRRLWRLHGRQQGIPYGLRYQNACFDRATGQLLLGESEHGLTCATFALAVFASLGVPLAVVESWPEREEDRAWQQRIVAFLRQSPAPQAAAHADRVASELGCVRFRPEEVAGAAAIEPLPATFSQARAAADRILLCGTDPA